MIVISTFSFRNQNPFDDFDSHEKKSNLPIIVLKCIFILLLLIVAQSCTVAFPITNNKRYHHHRRHHQNQETMKVHPMPKKRNNITIQYCINNTTGNNLINNRRNPSSGGYHKKLRRLPHIFSRVLELPFRSDADVSVEENPDCFRFVAETDNIGEVRAHAIEIHPGVIKIVVRPNGYLEISSFDDLELDMWRFRLPESTRPELASAVLTDGELIVTVPKGDEGEEGNGNNGEFRRENVTMHTCCGAPKTTVGCFTVTVPWTCNTFCNEFSSVQFHQSPEALTMALITPIIILLIPDLITCTTRDF